MEGCCLLGEQRQAKTGRRLGGYRVPTNQVNWPLFFFSWWFMASRQQPETRVQLIIFPTLFFFLNLNFSLSPYYLECYLILILSVRLFPFLFFFSANRSSFGLTLGSKTKCRCGSERDWNLPSLRLLYDYSRLLLFSPEIPFFGLRQSWPCPAAATSCSAFSLSAFFFFSGKKNFVILECLFAIFMFPATDSIYSCIIAHTTVCRS